VAATNSKAISFFSKYCKNRFLYPSPRENFSTFLRAFQRMIEKANFEILFPVGEWTLIPISEHREKFAPNIQLSIGSSDAIQKTFDKALTLRLAEEEAVPIPRTFFVTNFKELQEASKNISYPAVIKSRWSWVWDGDKALFSRPRYVSNPQELVSAYNDVHETFRFPLIQEYVPGVAYHLGVLCNHSRLRALCCIKESRTIPVTGGYATMRETVELNSKMKESAIKLLRALDWHGVAEVEFKLDPRDNVPKFMEINGRFWGSLELAIEAGVDFPYLLYRLITEGDVKPVFQYKAGVRRRWLEGDIIHLSNVLKNVNLHSNLPYPDKLKTIVDFLKIYDKRTGFDCLYWDDLMPFLSLFLWGDIPGIVSRRFRKKIQSYITGDQT
jgi:predicted ATP-grasp superfamily ATP-dependent carboligase